MQYGAFGNMLCKNDKSREKKFSIWSSLFCIIVSCDLKYSLKWQDFFTVEWQQFFFNIAYVWERKITLLITEEVAVLLMQTGPHFIPKISDKNIFYAVLWSWHL